MDADAHLAAMREKMAAMAQMAEVSALQSRLAENIKSSMARIDKIMDDEHPVESTEDDEVAAWRRKIEALSAGSGAATQSGAQSGVHLGASASQQVLDDEPPPMLLMPSPPMQASSKAANCDDVAWDDTDATEAQLSCLQRLSCCFRSSSGRYSATPKAPPEPEELGLMPPAEGRHPSGAYTI